MAVSAVFKLKIITAEISYLVKNLKKFLEEKFSKIEAMFSDNLLSTKKVRLIMKSFFLALVALINAVSAEQEKVFIHLRVL